MKPTRLLAWILLVLPLTLIATVPATAQDWQGYLLISADNGDPIEGSYFLPDQTPYAMRATEFHHLVTTDEGTTQPYQKPLVVSKILDNSSSRLFQAWAQDEHLTVVLKLYSQNQLVFEFELVHARIVAMEPISESTEPDAPELEKLRFIYDRITVRDVVGGTEMVWTLSGWPV